MRQPDNRPMPRTVARQRTNAPALPQWVAPQLTQLVDAAPDGDERLHEIKYDGYRMMARLDRGAVKLLSRRLDRPDGRFDDDRIGRYP